MRYGRCCVPLPAFEPEDVGFGAPETGVTFGYWNVWCCACMCILDGWAPRELRRGFTVLFSASAARRLRAAVAELT